MNGKIEEGINIYHCWKIRSRREKQAWEKIDRILSRLRHDNYKHSIYPKGVYIRVNPLKMTVST